MTSISRGDLVRPHAASDRLAGGLHAARDIAAGLLHAAAAGLAAHAARRDLQNRPAWMLRDIGLTHGEIAAAVAGRR